MKKKTGNLKRTIIFTGVLCLIIVIFVSYIQLYGQNKITVRCSYLDPIIIDLFAFFAGLFLVLEGIAKILQNPKATIKRQFTRVLRIAFGCAIITLHIIQFVHK